MNHIRKVGDYRYIMCVIGGKESSLRFRGIILVSRSHSRAKEPGIPSCCYIGSVSPSMFARMMIGAVGWGTCSDIMGRTTVDNANLFFTAVLAFSPPCPTPVARYA
ncbi:uncharacterized protein LACBIDRAFT_305380 [Laccaria bicolor S238N-H82]|uniref:Predicted protein n=1 Tax=Laccaria bicolor (strain S238N-H82 / ATCC MYA-4686) TaxID=486041 RepID=B0CU35_LACBS|nr:uncharacterized protein LACBIDRAFT_305380 [Laccaria bicolor S238N-H82]EDR14599.1 predicted protein [Laccaria bicolor S238N-H82]|eukprot:XP_001875158.1 predicted protein [Laccaria bicolor S238N-H82]